MGNFVSSNQLSGAVTGGPGQSSPSISYAYATTNTHSFGVDITYAGFGGGYPYGEITPYFVDPAETRTVACIPFTAGYISGQSIKCDVAPTTLPPGLYTISFSQYASTTTKDGTVTETVRVTTAGNSLTALGYDLTFSLVAPATTYATSTISLTRTSFNPSTTEAAATSTATVPQSTVTVTVYATTVVSTSSSLTTTSSVSTFVVTKTCTPTVKPTFKCSKNNCLRALVGRPAVASSYCNQYQITTTAPKPSAFSKCGNAGTTISSACYCFSSTQPARLIRDMEERGLSAFNGYAPPDFTYYPTTTTSTTVVFASTSTDPDTTLTTGTSTSTDNEPATTTVTLFTTSATSVSVFTSTFTPASCITVT